MNAYLECSAVFRWAVRRFLCRWSILFIIMLIADDLARIAVQEQELQFASFDEETAWRLGSHVRALAMARKLSLVVDVRRFAQPLFYAALPGTTPDNVEWIRRKSNVTARFHRSSYAIRLELDEKIESPGSLWAAGRRLCRSRRQLSAPRARRGRHRFHDRFRPARPLRPSIGSRSSLLRAGPPLRDPAAGITK
jgi:Haem-degrading